MDGPEVMAPHSLDDIGFRSPRGLERVDAMSFFHLVIVQGSWEVLAPRGLPPSPSRCLQDRLVLILNWNCSFEGGVEVALGYGDFLRELEELKDLPLKERR